MVCCQVELLEPPEGSLPSTGFGMCCVWDQRLTWEVLPGSVPGEHLLLDGYGLMQPGDRAAYLCKGCAMSETAAACSGAHLLCDARS
eukprot:880730-Rhodomonas_salina.3